MFDLDQEIADMRYASDTSDSQCGSTIRVKKSNRVKKSEPDTDHPAVEQDDQQHKSPADSESDDPDVPNTAGIVDPRLRRLDPVTINPPSKIKTKDTVPRRDSSC
ncbi:MAG: hypothetical protein DWQ31_02260 [Planctomycetota bacterium]|nr:MAG: hypothetical protein DWQ31_02260 [Planctomycetota bacterium]REJ95365.1 MAG: hypothetical protein DWQ35_06455 [Planctomycetota bacterium]REK17566.1 MAG: hypothetical protein DWQ42_22165 [Planctomycetota bacterium]REK47475.1 MAG: hypothetical protein DWQ46_04400 [Planctomycetota bacterium]